MIITLCGSTRFRDAFADAAKNLTLQGHLVFTLGMFGRQASDVGKGEDQPLVTDEQKTLLDLVHLRKIQASDGIIVLNEGEYIGDSTRREILWARMLDKEIFWLEPSADMYDGDRDLDDLTEYGH